MPRSFRQRYGQNWGKPFLAKTHAAIGGVCCLCLRNRSKVIHHLRYCDRKGNPIAGREKAPIDIVPLCLGCHKKVHLPKNWIWNAKDPIAGNRNTPAMQKLLRQNYRLLKSKHRR